MLTPPNEEHQEEEEPEEEEATCSCKSRTHTLTLHTRTWLVSCSNQIVCGHEITYASYRTRARGSLLSTRMASRKKKSKSAIAGEVLNLSKTVADKAEQLKELMESSSVSDSGEA